MTTAVPLFLLGAILVTGCLAIPWDESTPLDEYVARDDGMYSYTWLATYEQDGYTIRVYNMTSQQWMDDSVTQDSIWWHYVSVAIPDTFTYDDAAMLYISGGNKNEEPPTMGGTMTRIGNFARDVGVPVVYIRNVPFQPTVFTGDTIGRTEDQIIARTWRLFIEEIVDDPDVNLLFPMTKAARKAVDLMVEVVEEQTGNVISKIMPTGFSKRGWTAWLTAATDSRVFCVAPVVLDHLNWNENLHHHNQAYGGWSWAFGPYWMEGVSGYIDHPRSEITFNEHATDPFAYNERMAALPKLIVSATGDEFFLLDDSHYFFDQLDGDNNFMQIMENTNHGLGGHTDRLWENYRSFFVASYENFDFPSIQQERVVEAESGRISVTTDRAPTVIRGWWADTTNVTVETDDEGNEIHRRDFRLRTLTQDNPIEWAEVAVADLGDNNYVLELPTRPDEGYRGFFIEMTFDGPSDQFSELNLCTEVNIIPDTFPFDKCQSEEECRGTLK